MLPAMSRNRFGRRARPAGPSAANRAGLADGVTFTGRGEPGATVQVRNAAGSLIGTGFGQRRRHLQRHAVPRPGQW
jgi:hypothetical protein